MDHRAGRRALVAAGAVAVVGAGLAGSAAFAGVLPSKSVDAVCGSSADVGQIAVAADSASDAWAIGSCNGEYVIEHWDGAHWALGPLTAVRQSTALTGVAATSAANVWVVGYEANTYRALVEHWNGSTWTAVDANRFAGAARGETELNAVSATTSGGTWAVGILCCPRGLIEHWNGSRMAASPDRALPRIAQSGFFGVAATSPRDVWAVGNSNARHFHALSERWNGRRWKAERAPGAYELYGVASTSPTNAWAVGSGGSASSGGGRRRTLERDSMVGAGEGRAAAAGDIGLVADERLGGRRLRGTGSDRALGRDALERAGEAARRTSECGGRLGQRCLGARRRDAHALERPRLGTVRMTSETPPHGRPARGTQVRGEPA